LLLSKNKELFIADSLLIIYDTVRLLQKREMIEHITLQNKLIKKNDELNNSLKKARLRTSKVAIISIVCIALSFIVN
jgi:hypothetical protein